MRKIILYPLIAIALLAAAAACYALAYTARPQAADIEAALVAAAADDSLSYTLRVVLHQPRDEMSLFEIAGEQAAGARHISGQAAGSELDIYWIEGLLYQRDFISGDWICSVAEEDKAIELYHELSPLGLLPEAAPAAFSYEGLEQIDGCKLRRVSYNGAHSGWLGRFFAPGDYTLWLERRAPLLRGLAISAALKDDERYRVELELWLDGAATPSIEAPAEARSIQDIVAK